MQVDVVCYTGACGFAEVHAEIVVALDGAGGDWIPAGFEIVAQRGASFDRDYWVTVAEAQSAESDMLTSTAAHEPALLGLVSEMSQLYDQSSRRALAAASGVSPSPETANPPGEPSADGHSH